jgi:hypothetical protein
MTRKVSDRDRADLIAHARAMVRDCEQRGDRVMADMWQRQAKLWATDLAAAVDHLHGDAWRTLLRDRVDPATAEVFARISATGRLQAAKRKGGE